MTASILLAPLLDGPLQPLTVAHRSRLAVQLAGRSGRVVACVVFPGAVRLPYACAVGPSVLGASSSSSFSVGDGSLRWGEDPAARFTVARWWRPARPRHRALAAAVDPVAVRHLVTSWRDLLGRGPGLTPYGDDVLCGALVALHAVEHPAVTGLTGRTGLAASIASAGLERYTTSTSASLLRAACEGWCIDELANHLDALAAAASTERVAATRRRLLRVGSSSGRGLSDGVAMVFPGLGGASAA